MSVCANQDTFNSALETAIEKAREKNRKDNMVANSVMGALYLILLVWAVILAMRISDENTRILHMILAVLFPPLYVISYYIGNMNQ